MSRTTRRGLAAALYAALAMMAGTAFAQTGYQPAHLRSSYSSVRQADGSMVAGPQYTYQGGTIRQVVGTAPAATTGQPRTQATPVAPPTSAPGGQAKAPAQSILVANRPSSSAPRPTAQPATRVAQNGGPMPGTYVTGGIPGGVVLGPGETIVSSDMSGDFGPMSGMTMMGGPGDPSGMNYTMTAPMGPGGGPMAYSGPVVGAPMMGGPVDGGCGCGGGCASGTCPIGCISGGCDSCGGGSMLAQRPMMNAMRTRLAQSGVGGQRFGGQCYDDCLNPCQPSLLDMAMDRLGNICVFGGTAAFTGPSNLGASGSFGFQEGFIYSAPVAGVPMEAISFEGGARFVQSNFSGSVFSEDNRNQIFGTFGFFRRVDWGFQGGLVADYFHEDWYTQTDLVQLRGEASWIYPNGCHELGVYGTMGLNKSSRTGTVNVTGVVLNPTFDSRPLDTYNLFYRARFATGGSGRAVVGVSELGNFLVGADFETPLADRVTIESNFRYIIPQEFSGQNIFNAQPENIESWNVGIGLRICLDPRRNCGGYHRALLPVADNGTFFVNRSSR